MLKINKRTGSIKNVILFLFLSVFFVFIAKSLFVHESALNVNNFIVYCKEIWWLVFFNFFTIVSIYYLKLWSKYVFLISTIINLVTVSSLLLDDFNKLIFLMIILYIVFSHYFFIVISEELKQPIYNPNFSRDLLDIRPKYLVKVSVKFRNKDEEVRGVLTNWNEMGCFVLLETSLKKKSNILEVTINFKDKNFNYIGKVYSSYDNIGYGIVFFEKKDEKNIPWYEFYDILEDFGYYPEYLV